MGATVASAVAGASVVGRYLTLAGAVAFQFLVILLPLVGPSGAYTSHAAQNRIAWWAVGLLALTLSGAAFYLKGVRTRGTDRPFPVWTAALLGATLFLLLAEAAGLLRI
jgi:hypothetical protein